MCADFDVDHGVDLDRKGLYALPESERVTVSVAPQIERKVVGTVRRPPTAENAADERYYDGEIANEERGAALNSK